MTARKSLIALVAFLALTLILSPTIQSATAASALKVAVKASKDPITRGSKQTITVTVTDADNKVVKDAKVKATVTHASGDTIKNFEGKTDKNGKYSFTWQIGGNSKPGTFTVKVAATKSGYDSGTKTITFKVTPKN